MFQLQPTGSLVQGMPPPQEEWQPKSEQSKAGECQGMSGTSALYRCGGSARRRSCHGWYVSRQQASCCCFFDSGASHSFMSQAFASRHDQEIIEVSKGGYNISSAGGTVTTKKIVKNVLISIQGREYTMDLIIFTGLSISVILGMNWMKDHGVLIDTSTRTIMLREPTGGNAFLVPLSRNFEL